MVLLPEERGMTLVELRQMAARQQHQIEAQQQLLVAKEQRLKFLKQQEARHHVQQLESTCLLGLRDKVKVQELKLRQLRALRGQVDQQKTNNGNLGAELESIRALFCEKEKELDLAVSKVEELTRQLDEIRNNNNQKSSIQPSCLELENMRRELLYRTKLSEQQNNYICQQREKIANRQQEISMLDQKINDLNKRLHRKRLLNNQFASQIHAVNVSRISELNSSPLLKSESRSQEILDKDHSLDDFSTNLLSNHNSDLGGFSLNKKDPKYQTLPYNTKFTLKDKQNDDSSSTEDESWSGNQEESSADVIPHGTSKADAASHAQRISPPTSSEKPSSPIEEAPKESKNVSAEPDHKKLACLPLKKNPKPAIPPKPAISVKPIISVVNKDQADSVNKALKYLNNKSSEKEKNEFRHSKEPAPELHKSRILTYFSKTLLQPEGSSQDSIKKPEHVPVPKRKAAQLPIKPKPLTIRKTPGIEPPKLKVPVATLTPYRKIAAESNFMPSQLKVNKVSPPKSEEKASPVKGAAEEADVGASKQEPEKEKASTAGNDAASDGKEKERDDEETDGDEVFASDEPDLVAEGHRSVLTMYKIKKGNLKCEGTIRNSRRVSFDPLALLLDAALEGELELVKKTAREVVNPSAANDEGITALHNAICAGHFDVVKFLVEFGCDVNAQDSDGWTPLHCAASCNNLAMVKFLVEKGACIFATTLSDQETAAEKCEEDEEGFDGCSEYLYSLQENLGIVNDGIVYAVYDYDGQNADELSFRNGDAITVLRRIDNEENEWWWSRLNDEEGYVPRNLLGLYPRVNCTKDKTS